MTKVVRITKNTEDDKEAKKIANKAAKEIAKNAKEKNIKDDISMKYNKTAETITEERINHITTIISAIVDENGIDRDKILKTINTELDKSEKWIIKSLKKLSDTEFNTCIDDLINKHDYEKIGVAVFKVDFIDALEESISLLYPDASRKEKNKIIELLNVDDLIKSIRENKAFTDIDYIKDVSIKTIKKVVKEIKNNKKEKSETNKNITSTEILDKLLELQDDKDSVISVSIKELKKEKAIDDFLINTENSDLKCILNNINIINVPLSVELLKDVIKTIIINAKLKKEEE